MLMRWHARACRVRRAMSWPFESSRMATVLTSHRLRCALAGLAGVLLWLGAGCAAWELAVRAEEYPTARLSVEDAASLVALDRRGRTLWQAGSRNGEQRSWTPLVEMAPVAVQASLASEDH